MLDVNHPSIANARRIYGEARRHYELLDPSERKPDVFRGAIAKLREHEEELTRICEQQTHDIPHEQEKEYLGLVTWGAGRVKGMREDLEKRMKNYL